MAWVRIINVFYYSTDINLLTVERNMMIKPANIGILYPILEKDGKERCRN